MSLKDGVGSTVGAMRSALVSVSPASDLRCCSSAGCADGWGSPDLAGQRQTVLSMSRDFSDSAVCQFAVCTHKEAANCCFR